MVMIGVGMAAHPLLASLITRAEDHIGITVLGNGAAASPRCARAGNVMNSRAGLWSDQPR